MKNRGLRGLIKLILTAALAGIVLACSDGVFIETPLPESGPVYPPEGFSAPEGLRGEALSPRRIRISWAPVPEAVKYRIYRAQETLAVLTPAAFIQEIDADSMTYDDTGLNANSDYCYRISAVNAGGDEASGKDYITVKTLENLSTPMGFRGDAPSPVTVALLWHPVPDADHYNIYRSFDADGPYTPVSGVKPSSPIYFDITVDPENAETYYYKVSAVDGGGKESSQSLNVTVEKSQTAVLLNPSATGSFTPGGVYYYYFSGPSGGEEEYDITWHDDIAFGEHLRVWVYHVNESGETLLGSSTDPETLSFAHITPGRILIKVEGQTTTAPCDFDLSWALTP
jgi:hypothetical protein